jgi:hypothetical protein
MRKEKQVAKMEMLPQDKSGGREGGSGRRSRIRRPFVQANLKARGYQVLTAANGEDALQIAEKEKMELT